MLQEEGAQAVWRASSGMRFLVVPGSKQHPSCVICRGIKKVRKRTYRKPVTGLNLFQKAEIRRAWQADTVEASIHALIGEDVQALVRLAGAIIYGVVSACEDAGIDGDDADLRLVHSAAETLMALPVKTEIEGTARAVIVDGLAACERLHPRLSPASIQRAAGEVVKTCEGG